MDKMKRFFNPGEPQQEESGVMNEVRSLSINLSHFICFYFNS